MAHSPDGEPWERAADEWRIHKAVEEATADLRSQLTAAHRLVEAVMIAVAAERARHLDAEEEHKLGGNDEEAFHHHVAALALESVTIAIRERAALQPPAEEEQ